ncbi:MAG: hypothetical protein MJZ29_12735 [Bacteroidaceae bacterium]|nr:hypothetical protein [Bacteroidaceae bacterium]
MWNIELTKSDKRLCRELIHVGLERECRKFVEDVQKITSKPIPLAELNASYQEESGGAVEGPWHKQYIKIFNKVRSFDKHVARRYDGITGGHYLDAVLALYCDDLVTDDEISRFSEKVEEFLKRYKESL